MPKTNTKYRGVWVPPEVFELQKKGELNPTDVTLLSLIIALAKTDKGCFASNEYLANHIGRSVGRTRVVLKKLRDMGLVKEVGFDGRTRHLEPSISKPKETKKRSGRVIENDQADRSKTIRQSDRKRSPYSITFGNTTMSAPQTGADSEGFGFVKNNQNLEVAASDTEAAKTLLDAIRKHLGPSHQILKKAKLTIWAKAITKLRLLDEVSPDAITKTMAWYIEHLGEEYIPEAYCAATFRKKYHAIEAARRRDLTTETVISPEAKPIIQRLNHLIWPKGASTLAPTAIQRCLEGYTTWVSEFRRFKAILGSPDAKEKYGHEHRWLTNMAECVSRNLVAPSHFVQGWMSDVHHQVCNWPEWNGDLNAMVYKPTSKHWRAIGRGWAEEYSGDPRRWDRLMEVMQIETAV